MFVSAGGGGGGGQEGSESHFLLDIQVLSYWDDFYLCKLLMGPCKLPGTYLDTNLIWCVELAAPKFCGALRSTEFG